MPYARPPASVESVPSPSTPSTSAVERGTLAPVRVMIAGGGTGGHLFPGVALAEHVRGLGGQVRFVGTARGIEARVLPDEGWDLDLIEVSGIKGRGIKGLLQGLLRLPKAWSQSRRLLRAFKPDVVVGVGGYASGPVVATASMMGIPTAILEQNSVPGITNRILSRLVKRVFATFPDEAGRFPSRKVVMTGNPIRQALLERLVAGDDDATTTRDDHPPRLLVFGGSQGAKAINEAMMAALPQLRERLPDLEIWHQTGRAMESEVQARYAELGLGDAHARVGAFIQDMSEPYRWCDLVVCRAGATSLSELSAVGCPALLIPFPHATDNHQEHNARSLVDVGAAEILLERDLSPEKLVERVEALLSDRAGLEDMRGAMLGAAKPEAAADIYAQLAQLAGRTA